MIRKVYEVDPMICSKCGFVADRPPPSHVVEQVALLAAEESGEYF